MYSVAGAMVFVEKSGEMTDHLALNGQTLVELKKVSGVSTPTYLHLDTLGSPRTATNAAKTVLWREIYDPFGFKLNGVNDKIGYTGHAQDQESGYAYMEARFYDPVIGRFLSTDPVDDGVNLYSYVGNDPLNATDPTGAFASPVHFFTTFAAGLRSGYGFKASIRYAWQSVMTDFRPGSQLPSAENTAAHAMAGQLPGGGFQNRQQAIASNADYIRAAMAEGRLGDAAHAIQDQHAAGHDFKIWGGVGDTSLGDLIKHFLQDLFPSPERVRNSYRDSVKMFEEAEARSETKAYLRSRSEMRNRPQQPKASDGWDIIRHDWLLGTRCDSKIGC
jgi:RHS repeat-associated protein